MKLDKKEIQDIFEALGFKTRSLRKTEDFFKKILIRNDIPRTFYDNNGIQHCTLVDFLTGKVELF